MEAQRHLGTVGPGLLLHVALSAQDMEAVHKWGIALILQEREACALACESEHVGEDVCDDCDNEADGAYNRALRDGATAIRERSNAGAQLAA